MRISLGDTSKEDRLQQADIYESSSSTILVIEPDPEDPRYLFVITDEEVVYKLEDKGEGKAVTVDIRDMQDHNLEVHLN